MTRAIGPVGLAAAVAVWGVVSRPAWGAGDGAAAAAPIKVSIRDAVERAQPASQDVTAARAAVDRADAEVVVARSDLLPQITGLASYTRTLASEFSGLFGAAGAAMGSGLDVGTLPFGQAHAWRVGFGVAQLLFDGGGVSSAVARAKAGVSEARFELTSARALAVLQAAEAYYDALLSHRLLEIAEATLGQTEQTLAQTQAAFEEGTQPEFDVLRAEVSRDVQRTFVVRQRARAEVALAELRRRIGVPFAAPIELTSTLSTDDDETIARMAAAAARIVGSSRAPVDQARAVVDMSRASLGVARAQRWPRISLTSDFEVVQYPVDVLPIDSDWRRNWTVGVVVSVPLFTGLRVESGVRAAESDVVAARARLDQTRELAAVDELAVREDVQAAQATFQSSLRTVEQAERAYDIARGRFEEGVSTQLELNDARLALERSRADQALAARDLRVARIRMALLPALPIDQSFDQSVGSSGAGAGGAAIDAFGQSVGAGAAGGRAGSR